MTQGLSFTPCRHRFRVIKGFQSSKERAAQVSNKDAGFLGEKVRKLVGNGGKEEPTRGQVQGQRGLKEGENWKAGRS